MNVDIISMLWFYIFMNKLNENTLLEYIVQTANWLVIINQYLFQKFTSNIKKHLILS